jgi:hypothetical protein
MTAELDTHLEIVVAQFQEGKVIPFLGAGASLSARPEGATFDPLDHTLLPNGDELAGWLLKRHKLQPPRPDDLLTVAQLVSLMLGPAELYDTLHKVFDADYATTPVHDLIARLPGVARQRGWTPLQVVVTTNYDDLMERALRAAGEPFDVITYLAVGDDVGQFVHVLPDGQRRLIRRGAAKRYPTEYLPLDQDGFLVRPAIVKLHGAVDRLQVDRDSYVISEDHYIDFLSRFDLHALIPAQILARLSASHFLFLGYKLRDWNVRAILKRIWQSQLSGRISWAILTNPDDLDVLSWEEKKVRIFRRPLAEYVAELTLRLDALPAPAAAE